MGPHEVELLYGKDIIVQTKLQATGWEKIFIN